MCIVVVAWVSLYLCCLFKAVFSLFIVSRYIFCATLWFCLYCYLWSLILRRVGKNCCLSFSAHLSNELLFPHSGALPILKLLSPIYIQMNQYWQHHININLPLIGSLSQLFSSCFLLSLAHISLFLTVEHLPPVY